MDDGYCSAPGSSVLSDLFCGTTRAAAATFAEVTDTVAGFWGGTVEQAADTAQAVSADAADTAQAVSGDAADTVQTVAPYSAAGAAAIGLGAISLPFLIAGGIGAAFVADELALNGRGRKALLRML